MVGSVAYVRDTFVISPALQTLARQAYKVRFQGIRNRRGTSWVRYTWVGIDTHGTPQGLVSVVQGHCGK